MRHKAASAIGLLAFALSAGLAALRGADLNTAVYRSILLAVVMAAVGYVAGFIAEKAVQEAVDQREPLRPQPTVHMSQEGTQAHTEERK